MPTAWSDVASSPDYLALPSDQQELARQQYFDSVVAPQVPAEHLDLAKEQFFGQHNSALPQEQSIGRTVLDQSLQGATFGFGDEMTDMLGAAIAPHLPEFLGGNSNLTSDDFGTYSDRAKEARGMSKERMAQEMEQNPGTAIASNIGGALLTGGAGATTKAGTTIADLLRSGNIAARVGKGALAGATSGALYGTGAADDDQRLQGAEQGALYGGGAGGAIPIIGAALRKPVSALINYGADKLATTGAVNAGEIIKDDLSKPLQKVYDRLRADFPDDVDFKKALYSYGSSQDKSLIESGGARTANLGMGAAQYPTGGAKATEFFNEATGKAPENLKATLSKTISPSTNYSSDVDTLLETGRAKAAPLYSDAFKANQSIKSPVINKILQTPEGKASLGEAVKNMQNEMARVAKPDPELTQMAKELSDIGMMNPQQGGVANGLKLKTLDYVKKSMDDSIKKAIRAGDDGEVRRISDLKNSLVSEIDKADKSGLYAKARATSGDYLSTKKAMEDGLEFLGDDVENISRRMSNMGAAEKQAYRAGVVKTIRNNIDGKYDGQNVATLFQKPATRQKLQSLLSSKDYESLLSDAKATDNIFKLRNQIVGGSPTAGKQIAAQEFDNAGHEFIADAAQHGLVRTSIKNGINVIKKTFDGLSDKSAGEVADILYETDPKEKYQIVKKLVNEANSTGSGLRSTQAAQKLKAFYSISDAVNKAKIPLAPVAAGMEAEALHHEPLRVTIHPSDANKGYAKGGIVKNREAHITEKLKVKLGREPKTREIELATHISPHGVHRLLKQKDGAMPAHKMFPAEIVQKKRELFFDKRKPYTVEQIRAVLG